MSKILKAMSKATVGQNQSVWHHTAGNLAAINPVHFTLSGFTKEELKKGGVIAVAVVALAGAVSMGLRAAATLERTNRQMTELSSLVAQQNRMIGLLSSQIKETATVHPQQVAHLQERIQEMEKTVAQNDTDVAEAMISSNLLKIAVDELQMSDHMFVEKYITLSKDLKNMREQINTEGRNL